VVDGGACPWDLDCHNCDKFVLSGADLLYWRRKREQWRLLAEGARDDATASYLHGYFEPTARAIDGLEKALAGLGLLDDALAWTCANPRTTSTAFGTSRSWPPTSPQPEARKMSTTVRTATSASVRTLAGAPYSAAFFAVGVPTYRPDGTPPRVSGLHLRLAGFLTPTRPLTRRGQRNAARRGMTTGAATALYDQGDTGRAIPAITVISSPSACRDAGKSRPARDLRTYGRPSV
jgi:hypothetical protein